MLGLARFVTHGSGGSGPSLNFNFVDGAPLSSQITFTRASSATFTGSNGLIQTAAINAPRFDYDPVTLAAKGLLIEEQRTNLFTNSDFNSGVSGTGLVTSSTMTGPTGATVTAAAFGHDGTTTSFLYKNTVASTTQYAISVFVRMDDGNAPAFGSATVTDATNDFVLVVSGAVSPPNAYTVQNFGGGLYRVTGIVTSQATNLGNNGVLKYNTNSSRTFKTSGWQLEAGSFATSYIPTVASQVTRSADVASVNTLSPWFNASTGTFYAEADITGAPASNRLFEVHDGTDNNRLFTYTVNSSNSTRFHGVAAGASTEAIAASSSPISGVPFKAAGAFTAGEYVVCYNGGTVGTAAPAALPTGLSAMVLGARRSGAQVLNGHLRRLTFYPRRLPNATLQQITS